MKSFDELELITPLQRALAKENYQTPTPIQARTIPAALIGLDVLGCAQTGTGKTAAFALPILNELGHRVCKAVPHRPLALVLAPTRELAIQIGASFRTYGRHLKIRHSLVYGGVNQAKQVREMTQGAHIVVATPGRLLDLMDQGHIELGSLQMFVLDEADRMLDMGFLPDLQRIIRHLPDDRQSMFFSATLPPKIVHLARRLLTDPATVDVTPKSRSVARITQKVILIERRKKQSRLQELLGCDEVHRAIVFTRTKRTANIVEKKLVQCGIKAAAIHGNKSQNTRQRVLEAFRQRRLRVLVATDVAARGIDIDGVTHVVNFDLPNEAENYVHRIGRTGRAGAEGIAVTFCTEDERRELRAIENLIGKKLLSPRQRPRSGPTEHQPKRGTASRNQGSSGDSSDAVGGRQKRRSPNRSSRHRTRRVKQMI